MRKHATMRQAARMSCTLVVMGVSLGMLGIEEAGVEIEDPFGLERNHLPLDQICATIGKDVADLAEEPGN